MFFGVQERKKKKNEISFLHFIVFLKEEIKKGKKQINISQALKYQEQKSRQTKKEKKKKLKNSKKTKPTQPYKNCQTKSKQTSIQETYKQNAPKVVQKRPV